jgi:hypothetical protein
MILYEHEPGSIYKYAYSSRDRAKGVEREVKCECIVTGDSGREDNEGEGERKPMNVG